MKTAFVSAILFGAMATACSSTPATKTTTGGGSATPGDTSGDTSGGTNGTITAPAAAPLPPLVFGAPGATVQNISLAQAGLERESMDTTADPCNNFYQFACGGWIKNNPIPADKPGWARFGEVDLRNEANLRALIEEAAAATKANKATGATKQLGTYYASCMDEAGLEKKGLTAIAPILNKTKGVKDDATWFAALTELHKAGIWVVWSAQADADLKDSRNNVMWLDSAGLGLPDRDYYFDASLKDKLDAYRAHVARTFVLMGLDAKAADAAAANVLAIDTALAKVTKTGVERRDIPALYNPTDDKGLAAAVTSVNWANYWKALGVAPGKQFIVTTPAFFAAIDGARKSFAPAAWSQYFTYHLVSSASIALPKAYDDEAFSLAKAISGVEKQRDRYKRCIDSTQSALDHAVAQAFVAKHFPGDSKASASSMIDAIIATMHEEIGGLAWMSPTTRQTAQAKLGKLAKMVGYPDKWRTYTFNISPTDFYGNRLRAAQAETKRVLSRAGKPVDRSEWLMGAYEVNAYYNPSANNTALPAGILQPPFFGANRSVAANLGGIGMVIGHELTHGFDDQGAQFDGDGNLQNWWQASDLEAFKAKGICVAKQYSSFEIAPKLNVNGELTLGENIADLGGVKMAFGALMRMRGKSASVFVADGYTEPQQYFIGVAQAWCSHYRPAEAQRRQKADVHSPPNYRVFGALRNFQPFAQAFNCKANTPMRPANTCNVW